MVPIRHSINTSEIDVWEDVYWMKVCKMEKTGARLTQKQEIIEPHMQVPKKVLNEYVNKINIGLMNGLE